MYTQHMNTNFKTSLLITTLATSLLLLAGCTTLSTSTNVNTVENTNTTNTNKGVVENTNTEVVANSNENTHINASEEVGTIDWVTYTSDTYGVEFQMPKNWVVEYGVSSCLGLISPERAIANEEFSKKFEDPNFGTDAFFPHDITICMNDPIDMTLTEWVAKDAANEVISQDKVVLDGHNAIKVITDNMVFWQSIYVSTNNRIITIGTFFTEESSNGFTDMLTVDAIISSIHFISTDAVHKDVLSDGFYKNSDSYYWIANGIKQQLDSEDILSDITESIATDGTRISQISDAELMALQCLDYGEGGGCRALLDGNMKYYDDLQWKLIGRITTNNATDGVLFYIRTVDEVEGLSGLSNQQMLEYLNSFAKNASLEDLRRVPNTP